LDAIILVDQDFLNRDALTFNQATKLTRQASALRNLANVFGRQLNCIAMISENDLHALKTFEEQGFDTIAVNGNRPAVIQKLTETIKSQVNSGSVNQLILVSRDAKLIPSGLSLIRA
jgi:hypothetical protein